MSTSAETRSEKKTMIVVRRNTGPRNEGKGVAITERSSISEYETPIRERSRVKCQHVIAIPMGQSLGWRFDGGAHGR